MMFLVQFLWVIFTLILVCGVVTNGDVPPGKTFVREGGKFTLTCRVRPTGLHLWYKDGVPVVPDTKNRYLLEQETSPSFGSEYVMLMKLSVEQAVPIHSGEYKCSSFSPHSHRIVVLTAAMIRTNEEVPGQGIILSPPKPLELVCNTTEALSSDVTWFKDGVLLNSNDRVQIISENNTVFVKSTTDNDTGEYTCAVMDPDINATILVRTRTEFVEMFHSSLNLVQGDKLVLICQVKGIPTPNVTWLKDGSPLNTSDPRIKLEANENEVPNSKLIIEELNYDDRARYTCEANNGVNNVTSTILVRVKDKLAALWPFLGICAEVAVLCAIIFVYEKKRVKPDFDESDTDQNVENKNLSDQREGKEIRQRK
ncbi:basigin-like isoform X1 [Tachypleus tridentatus]|uniref:basigin-like isoform X1 n=1 Tax=Tachypleus tridentatus TaxID=6853 RepID=UPI003FD10E77